MTTVIAAPPTRGQLLAAALALAGRGVPVVRMHRLTRSSAGVACSCHSGAECGSPGKHPVGKWRSNPDDRPTTDPDRILRWWGFTPWNLAAEVPAGWLVVDTDARNGGPQLLAELAPSHGLPAWVDWNGTDEGRHYWLALPADHPGTGPAKLNGPDGDEIDLLWPGHLAMMPPSAHRNGGNREWLTLLPGEPPPAPFWLLEAVLAAEQAPADATPGRPVLGLPVEAAALLAELGPRTYDAAVIVTACGGAWQHGGLEAMIRCPAHDDHHPSASLKVAPNGRLLWHCYAGCSQSALTAAIRAIPGALLPRPEAVRLAPTRKPAPIQERKLGAVYRHRSDLREMYVTALTAADYTLVPANPPGSDSAVGYGSVYDLEERPRLWAAAVRECSLFARAARADCEAGGGRSFFGGYIQCRFKLCPTCSTPRLMAKAHEHDRGWKAAGVETFDVWRLEGEGAPHPRALPLGNEALRRWRTRGGGAEVLGASVLRTVRLEGDQAVPVFLLAVPAGTPLAGWTAGPMAQLAAGVGFDEVHEHQIAAWGDTLAQVTDTPSLEALLTVYRARCRVLEPIGTPRAAARKAEHEEAEAEGLTVPQLRKARKPQGAPCPWSTDGHRHQFMGGRFRYSDGRDDGGVWVFPNPTPRPAEPPPLLEPALGRLW